MKVLGIVGSMRSGCNTETLVREVISRMKAIDASANAEVIHTAELDCRPCRVVCSQSHCSVERFRCTIDDDVLHVVDQMSAADAVILGAPQYFRAPPASFHAMIERMIAMAFNFEAAGGLATGHPLVDKPCGLVAVAEYSNPQGILEYLHDASLLLNMRPASLKTFPYLGVGGHGDLQKDEVFRPFERAGELAAALVDAGSS